MAKDNYIERVEYANGRSITIRLVENPDPPQDILSLDFDHIEIGLTLEELADVAQLAVRALLKVGTAIPWWT